MQQHAGGFQTSVQMTALHGLASAAAAMCDVVAPQDPPSQAGRSSVGSITVVGAAATSQPPVKQPTLQTTINFQIKERQAADMAIAYFLYEQGLSFNTVEGGSFIRLIEALKKAPASYVAPSSYVFRTRLLDEVYNDVQGRLEEIYAEIKVSGCSIISDGLSDIQGES